MPTAAELIAQGINAGAVMDILRSLGIINVAQSPYSAKGDGVTNDTTSITYAKTVATAAGNKVLWFPHGISGVYKVDPTLDLTGFYLIGDNASFSGISNTITQFGAPPETETITNRIIIPFYGSIPDDLQIGELVGINTSAPTFAVQPQISNRSSLGWRETFTVTGTGELTFTRAIDGGTFASASPTSDGAGIYHYDVTLDGNSHAIQWKVSDGTATVISNIISVWNSGINEPPTVTVDAMTASATPAVVGTVMTPHETTADAEDEAVTVARRYLRGTLADGSNKAAIAGQTGVTYTVVAADVGLYLFEGATPTDPTGTGIEVFSPAFNIPVPAPPALGTPTPGFNKITCTFTQNTTFSTETYNAYYTIDGTTPTTASTKITGVTSPFDVTASGTPTVKVALEMVVNGVASALSSVVTGIPAVAEWTDNFDNSSLDTGKFTAITAGAGTVTETATVLQLRAVSGTDATLAGAVKFNEIIDFTYNQKYKVKVTHQSTGGVTIPLLSLVRKTGLTTTIWTGGGRCILATINPTAGSGLLVQKLDNSDVTTFWNKDTLAWEASAGQAGIKIIQDPVAGTYSYVEFETDKATSKIRVNVYNSSNVLITSTSWLDPTLLAGANAGENLNVALGDLYTATAYGSIDVDSAYYLKTN